MKKYIMSPLCSAFVVPGLGQVLNQRILKGLILMALVFILLIAIIVDIVFLIFSLLWDVETVGIGGTYSIIRTLFLQGNLSTLWILLIISIILWLYSIVDAFFDGLKIEKGKKGNSDFMEVKKV